MGFFTPLKIDVAPVPQYNDRLGSSQIDSLGTAIGHRVVWWSANTCINTRALGSLANFYG